MAAYLNEREFVQDLIIRGNALGQPLMDALDAAEDVYAIAEEFAELAPDVSLQDEARRLRTFEHRVRQLLIDWGALDANDPSPPDPINVLRMLLG